MKILSLLILLASVLFSNQSLTLNEAISILKTDNLEIKGASLEVDAAKENVKTASGMHWGKLDFIQDIARSDDAGNVFGFKLSSREATFGDFGAREFMNATGMNGGIPPESAYTKPPQDLNYPDSRNYYQSKLKFEVPVFTGFKITSYENIMNAMTKMKGLEKEKLINEKIFELRKSFYNMALLQSSQKNLNVILSNIDTLENITKNMIDVGYAKKVDLLEVQAKKGNVQRLVSQMQSNQKLLYHYISFLLNQKVTNIQASLADVDMPNYSNEDILKSNIDIKRVNNGLEIRKNMIEANEASYYPMVGAFVEVSTADDSFLSDANDHKSYTIGARITWNIFNGGIDEANIEKSRINFMKTQTDLALAKSGINLQVEKIKTEIKTSDADIVSLKKELNLTNEIYKNYEGRYKEKLSSMSDVIIKQSQQIEKILQLQLARNKRNEQIFALEKLANGEK